MADQPDLAHLLDLEAMDREMDWRSQNRVKLLFPDTGICRRGEYPKHLMFFSGGGQHEPGEACPDGCDGSGHRERCFMAGNRTGKTVAGAYEATLHATGDYPEWWTGRRFDKPTQGWACGTTSQKTAEIVQAELLGILEAEKAQGKPIGLGTGLLPRSSIANVRLNPHSPGAVLKAWIHHKSGGKSQITFKSYEAGREAFQGTAQDWIWLDEECPLSVYAECAIRTMTTNGLIWLTFTPLQGLSEVVLQFMPEMREVADQVCSRLLVQANWDQVPHLSTIAKDQLWASTPPFQREARRYGKPSLGAGAIYPVPESDFVVADFPIPDHWPRVFGLDVGWNKTAAIWAAHDKQSDVVYLYSEHYASREEPVYHVKAIQARGEWIRGVIDPAADASSQRDGSRLFDVYRGYGLNLIKADHAVVAGIEEVWTRLASGRLKVFQSNLNWLREFRLYRRDEKGRIVKEFDHLMDGTRYLVMSGLRRARTQPPAEGHHESMPAVSEGWMAG